MAEPSTPITRIASQWVPGAWIGAVRRAFGPVAEMVEHSDVVESHPPHSLLALWRPLKPGQVILRRWPSVVSIVAGDTHAAVNRIFEQIPPRAMLWLLKDNVDWALMAEIVMLSETGLERFHYVELQRFIDAQRVETLAAISSGYASEEGGHRRFVKTVPDPLED